MRPPHVLFLSVIFGATLVVPSLPAQVKHRATHGIDAAAFERWAESMKKDGYLVRYLNVHTVRGQPVYSAIAVENPRKYLWVVKHDLSLLQMQQFSQQHKKRGYRMLGVSGYLKGAAVRYATVWLKDDSKMPWQAFLELSSAAYKAKVKEMREKGFQATFVSAYTNGTRPRYAVIFYKSQTDSDVRHQLRPREFQKYLQAKLDKDYRPLSLSIYPLGTSYRIDSIFIKDKDADVAFESGLPSDEYQKSFKRLERRGFYLEAMVGQAFNGKSYYTGLWIKAKSTTVVKNRLSLKPEQIPATGDLPKDLKTFDEAMRNFMAKHNITAGALAVSKEGKLVLSRGYGWQDRERKSLLNPDAPFRIASVTKPITLAAIIRLIRRGKLARDTKVFEYLNIKPPPGQKADPRLKDITVQHLIDHKAGWDRDTAKIKDPMFYPNTIARALGKSGPPNADDIIHYMAGQPLQHTPGAKQVYSNFGYCVLGRVLEKATGKSYMAYLRQDLLAPLKIKSIELGRSLLKDRNPKEPWYDDDRKAPNVMEPKSKQWVPIADGAFHLEAMDAHGGLIASAPDLIRFLNNYWLNGERRFGGDGDYTIFGSLPGTWSMVRQKRRSVNIVVLFNRRAQSREDNLELRSVMDKVADEIVTWPK